MLGPDRAGYPNERAVLSRVSDDFSTLALLGWGVFGGRNQAMGDASDLSIFRFAREANTGAKPESFSGSASSAEPDPQKPGMVLDLANLTPETLEAFFPSEHSLGK